MLTWPTLQMCVNTATQEWTTDKSWSRGTVWADNTVVPSDGEFANSCNRTELPGSSTKWLSGSSLNRTSLNWVKTCMSTCGSCESVCNTKTSASLSGLHNYTTLAQYTCLSANWNLFKVILYYFGKNKNGMLEFHKPSSRQQYISLTWWNLYHNGLGINTLMSTPKHLIYSIYQTVTLSYSILFFLLAIFSVIEEWPVQVTLLNLVNTSSLTKIATVCHGLHDMNTRSREDKIKITRIALQTLATAWHEWVVGKSRGKFGKVSTLINGVRPFWVTNSLQWSSVVLLLSMASTNFIWEEH